jgi:sulfur-carrier protein
MPALRLFASAREAAGTGRDHMPGATVREVLENSCERYGPNFRAVLDTCRIWVNGEEVVWGDAINECDELAILPPVSGGV